jgi:hypothetical protein
MGHKLTLSVFKIKEYDDEGYAIVEESDTDKSFLHHTNLDKLGFTQRVSHITRPILRISCNGRNIYRRFKQGSVFGVDANSIGLLRQDRQFLKLKDQQHEEVEVSIVGFIGNLLYYWYSPKEDLRFAMRSAVIIFFLTEAWQIIKKVFFVDNNT